MLLLPNREGQRGLLALFQKWKTRLSGGGTAKSRSFYSCGPRKIRGTTRFHSLTAALQALPLPSLPIAPLSASLVRLELLSCQAS